MAEEDNNTETTPTGSGDAGQGTPPETQPGGEQQPPTTFTQADLDRIVGERVRRAERTTTASLLETLGVADQKELEKLVKAQREAEDAQKSELDKALEKIQALEAQNAEALEVARQQTIRSEVTAVATRLGFVNPDDAFALADLSEVEVGDDGKVTGVQSVLEALLESRPYLKTAETRPRAPDVDAQRGTGSAPGQQPTVQHLLPPALRRRAGQQQQ